MNARLRVLTGALVATATSCAQAVVLDFNGFAGSPNGLVGVGPTVPEDGFTLTSTIGGTQLWETYYRDFAAAQDGWQSGRGTSNGTTSLALQTNSSSRPATFEITNDAGSPFRFHSIDIGGLNAHNGQFYNTMATVWTFVGFAAGGGSVSYTVNTDPNVFSTYVLPSTFSGLVKVSVEAALPVMGIATSNGAGIAANFDNVVVEVTPVPEPETVAILLAGLGLARLASRRRQGGR